MTANAKREAGTGFSLKGYLRDTILQDLKRNKFIYIMLIPVVLFYLIFCYGPMYGNLMAFTNYDVIKGIWGSKWVGFQHFGTFFSSIYFVRVMSNTLLISFYDIIFGFPLPIIFALMINEVRSRYFKRIVQTVSYMPHFISLMVVVGMLYDFLSRDGLINNIVGMIGVESQAYLAKPEWFRTIFVASNIWQNFGWDSIIFLAAISNIDPSQYEAAIVDGAGRWKQILHVTLPGIIPMISIMMIFRLGGVMTVAYEKVLLLYSPLTYETADVIYTYVYRKGILDMNVGYTSAVGMFNSVINFIFLILANKISSKVSETKLW